MRKFLNICVVFLLLFSTSGVAISRHFCGEILQNIAFFGEEKSCCEGMEMPEDCCKSEVSILKSENLKLSQHDIHLTFTPIVLYIIAGFVNPNVENPYLSSLASYYHNPPPIEQDILIQVQTFLI